MKKNAFIILLSRIGVSFLLIAILSSCIFEQKNHREKPDLPKAFWNQEEYDRVMHVIHQPRNIMVNVTLHTDENNSSDKILRLFIGKKKYGSKEEFIDIPVNQNNIINRNIYYNHSFIGLELSQPLIPKNNGIESISFSWFKPGTWANELHVSIDTTQFFCVVYPALDNGAIRCDLLFLPDWKEKKVWVCFEQLFTLTSTPIEHPHELRAKEATIIRKGDGKITVFLNIPDFFRRWNKNHMKPWKAGDVYPVSLSLTLIPPEDFTRILPSNKKDPPFIPNRYEGKIDAKEKDPYLFIPSSEPLEEIVIETTINVHLTNAMINPL